MYELFGFPKVWEYYVQFIEGIKIFIFGSSFFIIVSSTFLDKMFKSLKEATIQIMQKL